MKSSSPQLGAFLWAGLGALLGGLAVTLLSPAPEAPETRVVGSAAPQLATGDPQLLELLRKLDRSLESLEVAIAEIDRSPAPARVPIRTPASDSEPQDERPANFDNQDLADALWALTQRMERLPQGGAGSSIPARDVVPVADKPAALGSGQWSARLRNGEEAWHETNQGHRNQHYGWSSNDLGQSYGHPDELWFEEGDVAVWLYEYEVEPGIYEAQSFFLKDGTVFNSEIDWWSDEEEEWEDLEFGEEPDEG